MTITGDTGLTLGGRREGFLVGAAVGASLAAATAAALDADAVRASLPDGAVVGLPPGAGRGRASVALADALLEELVAGGVDLRRLARRWVEWHQRDGLDADPALRGALEHLGQFEAPIPAAPTPCFAAVAAALPAALTSSNPQAMIAGAFHVSRLLDPTEATALAAVAAVVTASRLLDGHRDFIPDVLAVVRANDAPPSLVEAIARVPRDPRTPPALPRGEMPSSTEAISWVLWTVHHKPRGVQALEAMVLAGGVSSHVGAVLGALIGARDGIAGWPASWLTAAGEDVVLRRALSARLGAT